jgi:hypothetical protein
VSVVGWLVVAAITTGLGVALLTTRRRLVRAEACSHDLERRIGQLALVVTTARREARAAALTAQRAAATAGLEDALPRLAFEPVTAPIVRAVAFGAGARHALARVMRRSA